MAPDGATICVDQRRRPAARRSSHASRSSTRSVPRSGPRRAGSRSAARPASTAPHTRDTAARGSTRRESSPGSSVISRPSAWTRSTVRCGTGGVPARAVSATSTWSQAAVIGPDPHADLAGRQPRVAVQREDPLDVVEHAGGDDRRARRRAPSPRPAGRSAAPGPAAVAAASCGSAAPSRIAVCASCPQPWQTPSHGRAVVARPSGRAAAARRCRPAGRPSARRACRCRRPRRCRPAAAAASVPRLQRVQDQLRGPGLGEGQLGVGVQVTADRDDSTSMHVLASRAFRRRSRSTATDLGRGSRRAEPSRISASRRRRRRSGRRRARRPPRAGAGSWRRARMQPRDRLELRRAVEPLGDRQQVLDQVDDRFDDRLDVARCCRRRSRRRGRTAPPATCSRAPATAAAPAACSRCRAAGRSARPGTATAPRRTPISSSVGSPSQMRSSTVPKPGCGRMSHHTSRIVSMACDGDQRLHVLLELVPAGQLVGQPGGRQRLEHLDCGRTPARCPSRSSTARTPTAPGSAACRPSSALTIGIAFSGARTPQCTCTPKICSWRAIHCVALDQRRGSARCR